MEYVVFPYEAEGLGQCIIIYKIRREKKNREVVKLVETKTRKAQQMRNLMNEKELEKYWGKIMSSFKNSAKSTSYCLFEKYVFFFLF